MKKIYILLVAIFAISSTSCSDYLDSDYIFEDRETKKRSIFRYTSFFALPLGLEPRTL